MAVLICYFGAKFDPIFDFLKTYLREGMVFVDVGANIGSHAVNAARLVGRRAPFLPLRPIQTHTAFWLRILSQITCATLWQRKPASPITPALSHFTSIEIARKAQSSTEVIVLSVTLPSDTLDQLDSREYENRYFESGCGGSGTQRTEGSAPIFLTINGDLLSRDHQKFC